MTEHEQLKQICDVIGYNNEDNNFYYKGDFKNKVFEFRCLGDSFVVDVREIIFTPEFIEKFIIYIKNMSNIDYKKIFSYHISSSVGYEYGIYIKIMENLDNPVQYLYNLLNLGKNLKN